MHKNSLETLAGHRNNISPEEERQRSSLAYIVTRGAELYPERIAVIDLLNGVSATYSQLEQDSNRLARLMRRQGLVKGDLVAIMFNNELSVILAYIATAKIGAIASPLNVRMLSHEVRDYLTKHEVRAVTCSALFCDRFVGLELNQQFVLGGAAEHPWINAFAEMSVEAKTALAPVTSLADPFRMIPTGGTTGVSKGVIHSHGGTLMTILSNIAEFGIKRGWKTVQIAPAYHGAGTDWGMFPLLWRGGTVIMPEDVAFNPTKYLALLKTYDVEFALLVPAVIDAIYRVWDHKPITSIRSLMATSAPTSPALRAKLAEMFPEADLFAGAGISESLNMAVQSPKEFLSYPTSIGEPHLDTRMFIVDESGRELPRGIAGEICLRGFNTALYYHFNEEASRVVWRKRSDDPEGLEWCFTGDIGIMDSVGRVSIIDRIKDVIITGGETVPSLEIENAFGGHHLVRECAAVGLPDERWGEAITLVVVKYIDDVDDATTARELFSFGRLQLSGYKVPKQIVFVEALPRSHFGKVLKRVLRLKVFPVLYLP
jgi:acyl-CoA synthetase (AMP-forming)/AMP-acid ligase II